MSPSGVGVVVGGYSMGRRMLVVGLAILVATTGQAQAQGQVGERPARVATAGAARADRPVAATRVGGAPRVEPTIEDYPSRQVRWPGAVAATVDAPAGGPKRVDGSVVSLSRASKGVPAVGRLSLDAKGNDVARGLGGHGIAFALTNGVEPVAEPAPTGSVPSQPSAAPSSLVPGVEGDATAAGGRVRVTADVSGFSDAFGGGFATRLHFVEVSRCAFDAATKGREPAEGCSLSRRVVETVVDPVARTLSADLEVSSAVAYVAAASTSGQEGSYSASPLTAAGSWSVGLQSGSFTYEYPLPAASALTGPTPDIGLQYSSASVDGMTAGDNSQAPPVGIGWGLGTESYIERLFKACSNDGHAGMGDLCWGGDHYRIVMNGKASALVRDTSVTDAAAGVKVFRLRDDPGWRLELSTGSTANGDNNGERWDVFTPDGTRHVFGRGFIQTAGVTGNRATNATLVVPVFGDDIGEPCYNNYLSNGHCLQAWRWNIELTQDTHNNQTAYFYTKETNKYRRYGGYNAQYDRAAHLNVIEYDSRFGYPSEAPRARVVFANEYRCKERATGQPSVTVACPTFSVANAASYPDVPTDLVCTATCTEKAPTFFSHYLLRSVTAQRVVNGAWSNVERVSLGYSFPNPGDGTSPALWLARIQREGLSGTAISLPMVTMTSTPLDNRVDYSTALGVAPLKKFRVSGVTDSLGSTVTATYGHATTAQACSVTSLPTAWDTNTRECFPRWWSPEFGSAGFGAFHKYVVTKVVRRNAFPAGAATSSTGSPLETTTYDYGGTAGWTKPIDPVASNATLSYSEWRGYGVVTTKQLADPGYRGVSSAAVLRHHVDRFYRGLHLKPQGGTTATYAVVTSTGNSTTDWAYLQGRLREHQEFERVGSADVEARATVHGYASSRAAVKAGSTADTLRDSYLMVETAVDERKRMVNSAGAVSTATVTTRRTFTSSGQVATVDFSGAGDPRCTTTSYAGDAAARALHKVAFPARVTTREGTCAAPGRLISDASTYYDDQVTLIGAPLSVGDPTRTVVAKAADAAGTSVAQAASTSADFDVYGRQVLTTDPLGRTTTTGYSAPTAATHSVTVTNALGHRRSSVLDPYRLTPVQETDENGQTTTVTFDALGRLTTVQRPGDSPTAPSLRHAYTVTGTAPSKVTTSQRQGDGSYLDRHTFLDSLGRVRQVQSVAPTSPYNGQNVTTLVNTRYDETGAVEAVSQPVAAFGTAGASMLTVAYAAMNETRTSYDQMGRPVVEAFHGQGSERWRSTTVYGGYARTTVTPPSGGVPVTTVTDALGRVITRTDGAGALTATTTYTYDRADRVLTLTDPGGFVSSNTYNLLGERVTATDPESGSTTTTYDLSGNATLVERDDGSSVATTYDALNRPDVTTAKASPAAAAVTVLDRGYDTATLGTGKPATSTVYSAGQGWTTTVTGYTPRGMPQGSTLTVPPVAGFAAARTYTTTVGYDSASKPTSVTYPSAGGLDAETVTTGFSSLGLPTTLTGSGPYVSGTTYFGDGALASRTLAASPSPIVRAYTYEATTNRLSTVTTILGAQVAQNDTMTWNPAGQLTAVTDTAAATPVRTCHTYDELDRLAHSWTTAATTCTDTDTTTAAGPAGYNSSWAYNTTGNITSARKGAATSAYTYADPAHPHAVTSAGAGTAYTYTPRGQMATRDAADRPAQALQWDPLGNLAAVTDTTTTRFVHSADGTRLARINPNGSTTIYLGNQEIDLNAGAETTARRYYTIGAAVVAIRTPTTLTWQTNDRQNGVDVQVTNGTTTPKRAYFDPFGAPRTGTATLATDRGWLGKTTDPTTGLTHLGARYYDTTLGRFLSPDPLLVEYTTQTLNAYTYSANNPITYSDPSGLLPIEGDTATTKDAQRYNQQVSQNAVKKSQSQPARSPAPMSYASDPRTAMAMRAWAASRNPNNPYVSGHPMGSATVTLAQAFPAVPDTTPANAVGHVVLDLGGLVPVAGEVADGINAAWYFLEGDTVNGTVSLAAMVPVVGWWATAARLGIKGAANTERAFTRFTVNGAGEATMHLRAGSASLEVTEHAAQRLTQRGISIDAAEATLQQQPFRYFHADVWKTGYYDPASRVFLGAVDGRVTTVIGNATPKYIANLQAVVP